MRWRICIFVWEGGRNNIKNSYKKASLTVEASLILPIFLFAMILIGYLGQMIRCQDEVQGALTRLAREASAEYGASQSDRWKSQAYYMAKLNTYIQGAGGAITFMDSRLMEENDEIDLVAEYLITPPFSIIGLGNFHFRQRVHTRAFTGVDQRSRETTQDGTIVYITDTGSVYHRKLSCTYLKLSISQVVYGDLAFLRNSSGGKYKACERCGKDKEPGVQSEIWITNYGDRYHTSRSCSGLKRSIREIRLSEVGSRTPCSKCGREE